MNKLLLLSGLVSFTGFGQITLTQSSFPVSGDEVIMSTLIDATIDYASTGANYNWDFSNLTPTGQRFINFLPISEASSLSNFLFGSFAPTPYKASYFNSSTDLPLDQLTATFPVTIDGISGFTRSTADAETMIGWEFILSGTGIPVRSDTIETRYDFPLEYGNTYASRGYTKLNMNPIYDAQWIQHRQRQSQVDGWGTIQTPYGTFNALRIHHIIQESDSIYISFNGTGAWLPIPVPESHEYEWRAAEEKEAVMRVKTSSFMGNEAVTAVEYRDWFNPALGVEENVLTADVFPNPANDQLCITATAAILSATLYDQQGKQIPVSFTTSGSQCFADVSAILPGMYYVTVQTQSGSLVRPFVKK